MERAIIEKSIQINAPKEKVWDVLILDEYNRKWFAVFMEGSHAETDWKEGSKVYYKDQQGQGLVSKVLVNDHLNKLSIEHQAVIVDNKEVLEGKDVDEWKGLRETYILTGNNGITTLAIEHGIAREHYDFFYKTWDNAFGIIKELAESN